jgi:hypothetical protein
MDLEVKRDNLRATRTAERDVPALDDGQALLRVSVFALTANNVTYAVVGETMSYWNFFPAEAGWGRVPVWGYADVESSRGGALREGERVYGYLPMSSHLVVEPRQVTEAGFVDATQHRSALPPAYNQYQRVAGATDYDPKREREYSILRPLYVTSFLIDDWLDDNAMFGAGTIVLASASSKTALGLAQLLSNRDGIDVIGLTSDRNAGFVGSVGYYDDVVSYDDITRLPVDKPSVFVDMAGGGRVLAAVHRHLGDTLQHSCFVGITHWEDEAPAGDVPGPAPTFFFAPDQLAKRRTDWGPGGVESRIEQAWEGFLASVDEWLTIEEHHGFEAIEPTWLEVVEGRAAPNVGHVVTLNDS